MSIDKTVWRDRAPAELSCRSGSPLRPGGHACVAGPVRQLPKRADTVSIDLVCGRVHRADYIRHMTSMGIRGRGRERPRAEHPRLLEEIRSLGVTANVNRSRSLSCLRRGGYRSEPLPLNDSEPIGGPPLWIRSVWRAIPKGALSWCSAVVTDAAHCAGSFPFLATPCATWIGPYLAR